ncbi:MAG: hypothetical protein CVU05_11645 [Bacteroidetes bacterium HGW-Bacteroidetes-21]|jgi:nucleotide-binding universal stress UspA family protein|nr:MAG: hypothetical protein CVU05_11645 [Bacteroidetes bacterium HGW-Bacteroidetes-21]
MTLPEKPIMVPVDFSELSVAAIQHAMIFAKTTGHGIVLVHIVSKDHELPAAEAKLKEYCIQMEEKFQTKFLYAIKRSDLFKGIKTLSIEMNAMIIIMGLHSAKRAIKVIVGSNVPFLLIQMPPINDRIIDLVVPVDTDDKNRIQLNWVAFLSHFFKCNINLIKPFFKSKHRDEKMRKNIFFYKNVLENKGIVYGIRTSKRDQKFNDSIYDFAQEIQADLIFIMSYQFKEFILKANKFGMKIPVLCINPATNLRLLPGKF